MKFAYLAIAAVVWIALCLARLEWTLDADWHSRMDQRVARQLGAESGSLPYLAHARPYILGADRELLEVARERPMLASYTRIEALCVLEATHDLMKSGQAITGN